MEDKQIKEFIEKVKLESNYNKFLKIDIIYQLINIFNGNYIRQNYLNEIKNPLEIALKFYKNYNIDYYNMIIDGIKNGKIIISNNGKSFVKNNMAFIRLFGNDGDLFSIVHEFAHFVDRNSNPKIIPNEHWFLVETFAFYMEKKLELWLDNEKYKDLVSVRKNNRMFFEQQMLNAIKNELYYETLYLEKGIIETNDIDIDKIKSIIKYDVPFNMVNVLLSYPVANILSDLLIHSYPIKHDNELVKVCLSIDLYEVLKDYSIKEKIIKK